MVTNIIYIPIADKCKKIAITSSYSGEGKSYVSTNLAIMLASTANKKVLLLDTDIRKPDVKRLIGSRIVDGQGNTGLSEYVVGIDEKPNILKTTVPNLDVMFSGLQNSNPTAILNSEKVSVLFDELSKEYDYLIIDTSPAGIVSDALLLANKINGYIISSKANYSNINSMSQTIESIKKVGGNIFGVVLTAVNLKSPGVSNKNYPYRSL